jgi:hypothetical protein
MTMTISDLMRDLGEQLESGVDPETPILLALQEHYPLISTLRATVAVYPLREDEEREEPEVNYDEPCSHILLAEGSQRNEWTEGETGSSPYTTPAEDAALASIGWGSAR